MGGNYGSKVIYLLKWLSRSDLYDIGLAKIHARPSTTETNIQRQQTIAIDCNNIIHVILLLKGARGVAAMEAVVGWATVTVSEVISSSGVGCGKG